jgi:phosphoglycolate phosphatase
MQYQGAIFDLDGTLLDTLQDIAHSGNAVLANNGFPTHEINQYRMFIGSGITVLMARALPEDQRDPETAAHLADEFQKEYGRNGNAYTKLYPGIAEMLSGLQAHHLKLAVLSNKPHEFTRQCVNEFLHHWTFEAVLGYNDIIPPKPDPTGALQIVGKWNLSPSRILYLGDSGIDMQTAKTARMFPIGALWGFRSKEELLENGAKALIQKPQDILAYIK